VRVLVIGAGIIGCATAYELARRGARVTLIDMRHPGEGATNASAGVLAPYIESHSPAFLTLATESLSMYDAFVDNVRRDAGSELEYQRAGSIEIAMTGAQEEHLRERAAIYRTLGVAHQLLDAGELRALEPGLAADAAGGVLVPTHGLVSARHLTAALSNAAARFGAVSVTECRIDRVTAEGREVRAFGGSTVFDADALVLAAGTWSGNVAIERTPAAMVKPIRGQMLYLESARPLATRVLWSPGCYLVPWRDGTLLTGATSEDVGFEERATAAGVRGLLEAACEVLPAVWAARFREVRVGLRPSTPDNVPIIGRAAALPDVVYATGHYRNGVLLAPLTASLVADLVLDGRAGPELDLTSPARFGL
jgi:glycine oxidase